MNEILDFILRHWQLSGLFILLLVAYMVFEFKQETGSGEVSSDQAIGLINHQHAVIIDVRSKEEFATGHILGAHHVESTEPDAKLKRLQKYSQKPVIVVCAQGKRSTIFAKRLREQGLTNVSSLAGGLNAWRDAGLPLTTVTSKE